MSTERFIIPDGDLNTDVTLIDTSTGIEYEDNFKDIVDLMNTLDWSKQLLETQILHLKEDLDYYKSKCASLEEGLIREERDNHQLKQQIHNVMNELNNKSEQGSRCQKQLGYEKSMHLKFKKENEQLKTELTELKASEEDNYNIDDGLW